MILSLLKPSRAYKPSGTLALDKITYNLLQVFYFTDTTDIACPAGGGGVTKALFVRLI